MPHLATQPLLQLARAALNAKLILICAARRRIAATIKWNGAPESQPACAAAAGAGTAAKGGGADTAAQPRKQPCTCTPACQPLPAQQVEAHGAALRALRLHHQVVPGGTRGGEKVSQRRFVIHPLFAWSKGLERAAPAPGLTRCRAPSPPHLPGLRPASPTLLGQPRLPHRLWHGFGAEHAHGDQLAKVANNCRQGGREGSGAKCGHQDAAREQPGKAAARGGPARSQGCGKDRHWSSSTASSRRQPLACTGMAPHPRRRRCRCCRCGQRPRPSCRRQGSQRQNPAHRGPKLHRAAAGCKSAALHYSGPAMLGWLCPADGWASRATHPRRSKGSAEGHASLTSLLANVSVSGGTGSGSVGRATTAAAASGTGTARLAAASSAGSASRLRRSTACGRSGGGGGGAAAPAPCLPPCPCRSSLHTARAADSLALRGR